MTDIWSPDDPYHAASSSPHRATVEAGLPSQIGDLATPALLLDRERLQANLQRMAQRLSRFGVRLRPHMKTAKSAEVMQLALKGQFGGITVQTVAEAQYFARHGCRDILYAVSAVGSKLARLAALQRSGSRVTVVCDGTEGATDIQSASVRLQTIFPVLIEIDADGSRAGVRPDDEKLVSLARQIAAGPGTTLAGVLCHAGSAYASSLREDMVRAAELERSAAVSAAEHIRAAGLACETVSIGSSPSVTVAKRFDGITEVRAGVYMFNDLTIVDLGLCERTDIAMTVLATIISHNRAAGKIIIDAGALALSKDLGFSDNTKCHYGEVVDALDGGNLGLVVNAMTQEHGIIQATDADFNRLPVGSLVRILPNHACMTAGGFDSYCLIENGVAIERWMRCTGW